jgi:hypothetical protein
MCFIIDDEHPKIKIAKKDIICYKRFNATDSVKEIFISTYQNCRYYIGEIKESEIIFSGFHIIDIGLHSYSTLETAKEKKWNKSEFLAKCIIPKDSKYYYNSYDHEYVSNQLKVIEKI